MARSPFLVGNLCSLVEEVKIPVEEEDPDAAQRQQNDTEDHQPGDGGGESPDDTDDACDDTHQFQHDRSLRIDDSAMPHLLCQEPISRASKRAMEAAL